MSQSSYSKQAKGGENHNTTPLLRHEDRNFTLSIHHRPLRLGRMVPCAGLVWGCR